MPNNYFSNPIIFLIETLFSLYIIIVALRIVMQWAQWDHHHPISLFIVKATQKLVVPLRRVIPAIGRWDTATLILLFILTVIKLGLITLIQTHQLIVGQFFGLVIADILSLFVNLFTITIIIEVVLSWLTPPGSYNPIAPLIQGINRPILGAIRDRMPPLSGIDLSPLVAIIGLQLILMLTLPLLVGYN